MLFNYAMKIKTGKSHKEESLNQFAQRMATRFSIFAGVTVLLFVIAANYTRNPVPMTGDPFAWGNILITLIEPIIFISTFVAFYLGIKKWNTIVPVNRHKGWKLAVLPLSITTGLLASFLVEFGMGLFDNAFKGLELALLQGAAIATAVAVLLTYFLIKQIMTIDTGKMLTLLITALTIGVYNTMVSISDPDWWRISFSYLGTSDSSANTMFNHTLMLGGILIATWVPMFINDFKILERAKTLNKHSVKFTQYAFIVLGVAIFNVGMFPSRASDFSSFMHNISAYSLAGVFAIFMFASKWIVPKFSKEYFTATLVLLICLLSALFFAAIGYFNTVGLEMSGFVIGLAWLTQFVGSTETNAKELEPKAFPK